MAKLTDYAGATSLLSPDAGLSLDPRRYAWQLKHDGCYVRLSTDREGRVSTLVQRSGLPVPAHDARDLAGMSTGLPDAVLHGELEAHTEAGIAARAARGYPNLHLFDVSRWCGKDVAGRSYTERYGLLHRWQANVECYMDEPGCPRDEFYVDQNGIARQPHTHRFASRIPIDIRRLPIVPLIRSRSDALELWRTHVEQGCGEGMVAVRLDAPLGKRGAKTKIKHADTLDCLVVQRDGPGAVLEWAGRRFVVSARGAKLSPMKVGDTVEVACNGFYKGGKEPRFARIVRVREDKVAT